MASPFRTRQCSPPRGQSRTAATFSFAHTIARPSASHMPTEPAGSVAVAIKHEIVLAIVGGLFVLETVSVVVQVVSFKLTGKRVFRMAPIHHHYEQLGWTEPTIVIRFWIVAVVLALLGLATLKLR